MALNGWEENTPDSMMKRTKNARYAAAALLAAGTLMAIPGLADQTGEKARDDKPGNKEAASAKSAEEAKLLECVKAPPPKPISEQIQKGLAYLARIQNADGGWGQGGGWRINATGGSGRVAADQAEDRSDVGNSCVTMMAFLRSGAEFRTGPYAENLRKGAEYVMKAVEAADEDSLYVTHVRDTQLQSKIGRYVDTFLAAQILAEMKDQMATPEAEERRKKLLDKVVAKIGKHQKDDGAFAGNSGWASVLSQGLCSRSLNAAKLAGAQVSDEMLERDNNQNLAGLDPDSGTFGAVAGSPSSAGVSLYTTSSKLRGMQENTVVNAQRRKELEAVVQSGEASDEKKEEARKDLKKIDGIEATKQVAYQAINSAVQNDNFVKGFGNNGGEEFLSYMNISETMRAKGGQEWSDWDKKISDSINAAQNEDGSWAGHHCITGRTFCTAGALLTLMADRAPIPAVEAGDETAKVAN